MYENHENCLIWIFIRGGTSPKFSSFKLWHSSKFKLQAESSLGLIITFKLQALIRALFQLKNRHKTRKSRKSRKIHALYLLNLSIKHVISWFEPELAHFWEKKIFFFRNFGSKISFFEYSARLEPFFQASSLGLIKQFKLQARKKLEKRP